MGCHFELIKLSHTQSKGGGGRALERLIKSRERERERDEKHRGREGKWRDTDLRTEIPDCERAEKLSLGSSGP